MEEIISFGNKRTFNDFKRQIPDSVLPFFQEIREFCFSLGGNVVEDARMHRIVFGKSITFRWFADIAPENGGIILKIQKSRNESKQIIKIKNEQKLSEFSYLIKEAYEKIH